MAQIAIHRGKSCRASSRRANEPDLRTHPIRVSANVALQVCCRKSKTTDGLKGSGRALDSTILSGNAGHLANVCMCKSKVHFQLESLLYPTSISQ